MKRRSIFSKVRVPISGPRPFASQVVGRSVTVSAIYVVLPAMQPGYLSALLRPFWGCEGIP